MPILCTVNKNYYLCRLRTDNKFTKNDSNLSNSLKSGQNKIRDISHFWRWYV